jgi:hypothetical protein
MAQSSSLLISQPQKEFIKGTRGQIMAFTFTGLRFSLATQVCITAPSRGSWLTLQTGFIFSGFPAVSTPLKIRLTNTTKPETGLGLLVQLANGTMLSHVKAPLPKSQTPTFQTGFKLIEVPISHVLLSLFFRFPFVFLP